MSFRKQMEVLGRNAIMKHFFNMDNIYLEMVSFKSLVMIHMSHKA